MVRTLNDFRWWELVNVYLPDTEAPIAIGVGDGVIEYVGERRGRHKTIDGGGATILPGRIDIHVHDRDPSQRKAGIPEDRFSIQAAALHGGTTAIIAQPNTDPCVTSLDRYRAKQARLHDAVISYQQWAGATAHDGKEVALMVAEPTCPGVKLTMANTTGTGEMLIEHAADQLTIARMVAEHGKVLTVHAEVEARIGATTRRLQAEKARLGVGDHCVIRDPLGEIEAVESIVDIALQTGVRLNVCHVSTRRAVEVILAARQRGGRITFEICPQYCLLDDSYLQQPDGALFKCNPALRPREDAEYLLGVLCDQRIHGVIVATDHAPHDLALDKSGVEYAKIKSGMPGLETCLPLLLSLVYEGRMSWQRLIEVTSKNPARLLSLPEPVIAKGAPANIVGVYPTQAVVLRSADMVTACGWSPFDSWQVHGAIAFTVARGWYYANDHWVSPARAV